MTIIDIVDLFCYGVTMASILVKLTPTPKDDVFMAKIMVILDQLALNTRKN